MGRGLFKRRVVVALWLVAAMLLVFVIVGAATSSGDSSTREPCTHGISSIGPMRIVNGKAAGSTTPHTERCLP